MLVRVESTQGSVPREAGTWMAVFVEGLVGTIGGGHLEFEAIAQARAWLQVPGQKIEKSSVKFVLGPTLGQCCGGVVYLVFKEVTFQDATALKQFFNNERIAKLTPVALFGGGHVGHAIVQVLSGLPFELTWIDSRDEIFSASVSSHVVCEHSDPVQSAVAGLKANTRVLIMSFSHAEDLEVVIACLLRQREKADLPFIGLIGSKTKWATFRNRLTARGFTAAEIAHMTCPIGVSGIKGKEPEVIAVAVAAQLLQTLHAV